MLAVIYLIYNEGYRGRVDLAAEAIRLGRVLVSLMPDQPEAHGLLALMMIHHARRQARFSGEDLVLLDDQDRSLWDHAQIAAGRAVLDRRSPGRARRLRHPGGDRVAADRRAIDWPEVAELYQRLAEITGSPVVELNHAVALAQAGDPAAALHAVDDSTSTATSTTTPPAANYCAVSAATTRPWRRTAGRSTWPPRPPAAVPDPAPRTALPAVPRTAARSSPGYDRKPFPRKEIGQ